MAGHTIAAMALKPAFKHGNGNSAAISDSLDQPHLLETGQGLPCKARVFEELQRRKFLEVFRQLSPQWIEGILQKRPNLSRIVRDLPKEVELWAGGRGAARHAGL